MDKASVWKPIVYPHFNFLILLWQWRSHLIHKKIKVKILSEYILLCPLQEKNPIFLVNICFLLLQPLTAFVRQYYRTKKNIVLILFRHRFIKLIISLTLSCPFWWWKLNLCCSPSLGVLCETKSTSFLSRYFHWSLFVFKGRQTSHSFH